MSKTERRLPEMGEYVRGQGTLVAVEEIVPPPPQVDRDYIFEEITAEVELRLGSEVLNHICSLWDAYGKDTSVKSAIEEGKRYASERKIGPGSELEVVVVKTVEQVRKRPKMGQENFYNPDFFLFESLQFGSKVDLPDPVRTVVWSSREEKP